MQYGYSIGSHGMTIASGIRKPFYVLVTFLLISACLVFSSVPETRADEVAGTVNVGAYPFEIAVHDASSTALVTNSGDFTVTRIRTTDMTVTATINVGLNPRGIVIDHSGQYAYVTSFGTNKIWRINLSTNAATSWATVESRPFDVALDPTGTYLYVSNDGSSSVSRVATADASVTNISVGSYPRSIAITADGSKVVVVRIGGADAIAVIDTATLVRTTYPVYSFPSTVVTGADSGFAYVGNNREIMKVNLANGVIISSFSVDGTAGMIIDPSGRYIYGTENFFYDTIGVDRYYYIRKYSLAQGRYIEKIRTGPEPQGIAFSSSSQKLLVANEGTNTVSVLSFQSKHDQSITFAPSSSAYITYLGTAQTITLAGTASSGLAVNLASTTPDICDVTNNALVRKKVGTCTIRASQSGDSIWNTATSVERSINVLADPFPPAGNNSQNNSPSNPTLTNPGPTTPASTTTIPRISSATIPQSVNVYSPISSSQSSSLLSTKSSGVSAKVGQLLTYSSVMQRAGIKVPAGAKLSLTVSSASKSFCKVTGGKLKIVKRGVCKVSTVIAPKKGARKSHSITLQAT
jgi:YVTN family beta-propeller protein